MLLSNKAILALLWEMFPQSPYLLPASRDPLEGDYVRKPMLAREGANVQTVAGGRVVSETEGIYPGPWVYQKLHPIPQFDGNYAILGSWMVNGYACGIGIREDPTPVTRGTSRFVPHVFG
jgi:glutathionylspermidine synthase